MLELTMALSSSTKRSAISNLLVNKVINGRLNSRLSSTFTYLFLFRVKKWCKSCKKSARANRKEYFKHLEEQEFREKMKMQQELFNQAKVDPSEIFEDHADDDTF